MANDRILQVGVLGATGTVGQRFIVLLSEHPFMRIHSLGASERSAGKAYAEATRWKMQERMPDQVRDILVKSCDPMHFDGCDLVFSGLDASVAGDIEKAFLTAGIPVFSNAKNYRMAPEVPLVVPVVNSEHMSLIDHQRRVYGSGKGFVVTNSNCSTSGLVVALKALHTKVAPIRRVVVTTLQAISGAGYPGVASLDILDNIVPYIGGEEPKMEAEVNKILGNVNPSATAFTPLPDVKVSATCNRVPVVDGHTECVSVEFATETPPSLEAIEDAFKSYRCEAQDLGCPSAPEQVIYVAKEADRPQPRLDRDAGKGMSVTIGRIRECPVFHVKFTLLVHNTVLGAAGASILNAELALKKNYLS
ncbi:aspartate-semialdehyde dehydrogenase [Spiromyces aspiralis]|uniref:Aspartate-semialdehyde dehydrogenase n=1 Tax=Spiromyces aspiralis TaxID=68401 RepID=A0ACC1HHE1_9FUNG|nr:aspartate-semialdehyde dehydrogenase [Spiromyces aspiralis]